MADYAFVHDPSMIKEGNTYYVFSTGVAGVGGGNIQIRTSTNLKDWKFIGTVFKTIPQWISDQVSGVTTLGPGHFILPRALPSVLRRFHVRKQSIGDRAGNQQDAESRLEGVSLGGSRPSHRIDGDSSLECD